MQLFNYVIIHNICIVDAHISYRKPLIYPGSVVVKIYSELPGLKSWTIYHEIFSEDKQDIICAEASVKFVCFDPKTSQTVLLSNELKSIIYPQ